MQIAKFIAIYLDSCLKSEFTIYSTFESNGKYLYSIKYGENMDGGLGRLSSALSPTYFTR